MDESRLSGALSGEMELYPTSKFTRMPRISLLLAKTNMAWQKIIHSACKHTVFQRFLSMLQDPSSQLRLLFL